MDGNVRNDGSVQGQNIGINQTIYQNFNQTVIREDLLLPRYCRGRNIRIQYQ